MYKTLLLYLFILYICNSGSNAQNITIPLTDKIGNSLIGQVALYGEKVKEMNLYSGFDSLLFKKFSIKTISFYKVQDEVESMLSNGVPENRIKAWLSKYRDTSYVLYKKMPKNKIAFIDAVDNNGKVHFILDGNNNYRFDDDQHFIIDTSSIKKEYPIVYANYEYYNGRILKNISVPYKINVYAYLTPVIQYYADHIDTLKDSRLLHQAYKEGILKIGKNKYLIQLVNRNMFVYNKDSFDISIQLIQNNKSVQLHPYIYKSSQLIELKNALYKIDSLSNNKLYIHLVRKIKYGSLIGMDAPIIEGTDLMTNQYFNLKKKRNNYVLLNFWGSWCQPCIKELPALVELNKKFKNITFASIATDLPEDTVKLKKLIREKNLSWTHLWVHRNQINSGILWDYKIKAFPTTILIDPNGKIIFRNEGAEALEEIKQYLIQK